MPPWKDRPDIDIDTLKLSDVPPKFRHNDSSGASGGNGRNNRTAKISMEGPLSAKEGVGEPVRTSTPECDEDAGLVEGSGPLDEEEKEEEEVGGVERRDRSYAVHEEAPIPFTTPLSRKAKRGTSVSAFKVGMSLSLRTSPRMSWEKNRTLSAPVRVRKQGGGSRLRKRSANVRASIQREPQAKKSCLDKTTPGKLQ